MKRHGQWKSDSVVEGYIAHSEPIRKERETCPLPSSFAQQEGFNGRKTLGLVQQQPAIPTDLETFTDLNGFSQIYKEDLEIPANKQEPLLVLSQDVGRNVESEQDAAVGEVIVKERKGKLVLTEVFGNSATFNNCSFILHM